MDTGEGKFAEMLAASIQEAEEKRAALEAKYPNHGGWFQEGEIVEIKGSQFKVKRIKPDEIVLKLLKRKA